MTVRLCFAGFVLDERGVKMSKSIGNVVDPRTVMLGGKDQKVLIKCGQCTGNKLAILSYETTLLVSGTTASCRSKRCNIAPSGQMRNCSC